MVPLTGCHFIVSASPLRNAGCSAVLLPLFPAAPDAPQEPLVLQRGFTGALDFHEWWAAARATTRPRRHVVTVSVLATAGGAPVARWRFVGCVPLSLGYSPLDAMSSNVLIETLALSFTSVSLSSLREASARSDGQQTVESAVSQRRKRPAGSP